MDLGQTQSQKTLTFSLAAGEGRTAPLSEKLPTASTQQVEREEARRSLNVKDQITTFQNLLIQSQ